MDRNKFLDIIVNTTPNTSKDDELIEAMKNIHGYFREIKEEYIQRVNVQSSEWLFFVNYNGECTYVIVTFKNRSISFHRNAQNIEVRLSDDKFPDHRTVDIIDTIIFNDQNDLMSEHFDMSFSRELMSQYLDYLI